MKWLTEKPRKKREHPEDDLHIAVAQEARLHLRHGVFWFHVPNQRKAAVQYHVKLKQMGVKAGTPDLVFVFGGKSYFIELKAPKGGKTSDDQRDRHSEITRAGSPVAICKSVPEVLACWRKWGLTNTSSAEDAARRVA